MVSFRTVVKDTALMVATIVGGFVLFQSAMWITDRSTERDAGACSMLAIENKIDPVNVNPYLRACMSSKGYGLRPSCWARDLSVASCFTSRWMIWVQKI